MAKLLEKQLKERKALMWAIRKDQLSDAHRNAKQKAIKRF